MKLVGRIMKNFKYLIFLVLFYPAVSFCQEANEPGFGFTLGKWVKNGDELRDDSFELFIGPGLRNSKSSRWQSQYGFWYLYSEYNKTRTSEDPPYRDFKEKKSSNFYGFSYVYGRYFHISENQGIYAYGGTGFGLAQSKASYYDFLSALPWIILK